MAVKRERRYECSNCGKVIKRDKLTVKKVVFVSMGVGPRTLRSRGVGWLCPACLKKDDDWKRESFVAPGNLYFKEVQPEESNGTA